MNKIKSLFGFIILASMLLATSLSGKPKNKVSVKNNGINIQLYSVRSDIKSNFNETIAELGKMGYKG
ncbi:MAG: hypothetical protein VB066_03875, partial [Paludibacter sp.]|nr:hypothetical protein [Paludibacter sp.]